MQVEGGRCYIPGSVFTAPHPHSHFALGGENLEHLYWRSWAIQFKHNHDVNIKPSLLLFRQAQADKLSSCCMT